MFPTTVQGSKRAQDTKTFRIGFSKVREGYFENQISEKLNLGVQGYPLQTGSVNACQQTKLRLISHPEIHH